MDRLRLAEAGLRAFDERLPEVTSSMCVVTRYRSSSCRLCRDVCPGAAIDPDGWLKIDAESCTSCGACAAACRTGAVRFEARSIGLRAGLTKAAASGESAAILACRFAALPEGDRAETAFVMNCLGGLSVGDLIAAAATGLGLVVLSSGECAHCPDRLAGRALEPRMAAAEETQELIGGHLTLERRVQPGSGASAVPAARAVSRRGLFAYIARGLGRAVVEGTSPEKHGIADLHRRQPPAPEHVRLQLDLAVLHKHGGREPLPLPAALPLATIEVGPTCDACGLCVRYCPHGVFSVADGGLLVSQGLCCACGLCADVCPREALQLRPGMLPSTSDLAEADILSDAAQ
jgi:ferredoxin